jgi:hypothetical protein
MGGAWPKPYTLNPKQPRRKWGGHGLDAAARLQDLIRGLRRSQKVSVVDTAEALSALRDLCSASGSLGSAEGDGGCKGVIDSSEGYLLSEARRQFLGGL